MSGSSVFFGYPGRVWATCLASINALQQKLASGPVAADSESMALATFQTLVNGLNSINAFRYQQAWQIEALNIGEVRGLSIALDPTSSVPLAARSKALTLAAAAMSDIIPASTTFGVPSVVLAQGLPAIPDPGLLEFYQGFAFETAPGGLTTDNLVSSAQSVADAFGTLASEVKAGQGFFLTQAYDTLLRLQDTQQSVANLLDNIASSPFSVSGFVSSDQTTAMWNQLSALPALLIDAAILSNAPFSLANQQAAVIRNAIITAMQQIAVFLLILRKPTTQQINVATVQSGDNLMDVAARSLGDFEQWSAIAEVNGLIPPYVSSVPGSGVTSPGQKLLMPTGGVAVSPVGTAPNYLINFLGVDFYVGPINQPMPPWTGDFQTIAGYQNFAWALGRRLQTPLGALIYHGDYGSRIPGEVGNVQTNNEAQRVAAFGKSALLADPRTASVPSATATFGPNQSVQFQGDVIPQGFGADPVSLNETIGSAP
jgi:hypothetical protein